MRAAKRRFPRSRDRPLPMAPIMTLCPQVPDMKRFGVRYFLELLGPLARVFIHKQGNGNGRFRRLQAVPLVVYGGHGSPGHVGGAKRHVWAGGGPVNGQFRPQTDPFGCSKMADFSPCGNAP